MNCCGSTRPRPIRRTGPALLRRWYQDEFFDLYVWQRADGTLTGFQLCYDLRGRERALSWRLKHGFSHSRVDHVHVTGRMSGTPLLAGAAHFPHRLVRLRFEAAAAPLDPAVRRFIIDKMREFGRHLARGELPLRPRRRLRGAPPAG